MFCSPTLQPERALGLLDAATQLDSTNSLVDFTKGQAHGALSRASAAAACFRRAAQLTAGAPPGTQLHQLHVAAAENALLKAEEVLSPGWLASLHDAARLDRLRTSIAAAVGHAGGAGGPAAARVLVCGGMGIEGVLAAQAGAGAVTLLAQGSPLAAELACQLAADSGCGGDVAVVEQLQETQQRFDLVILADALGSSISWPLLQRQLAAAGPWLAPRAALLPHTLLVRGRLVACPAAVALNEASCCSGCCAASSTAALRAAASAAQHWQHRHRLPAAACSGFPSPPLRLLFRHCRRCRWMLLSLSGIPAA